MLRRWRCSCGEPGGLTDARSPEPESGCLSMRKVQLQVNVEEVAGVETNKGLKALVTLATREQSLKGRQLQWAENQVESAAGIPNAAPQHRRASKDVIGPTL